MSCLPKLYYAIYKRLRMYLMTQILAILCFLDKCNLCFLLLDIRKYIDLLIFNYLNYLKLSSEHKNIVI